MKTCPRCGAQFPDEFVYCDQDGAKLNASSQTTPVHANNARRRRNPARTILGAGLAIGALAVGSYFFLTHYVISRVSASVNNVSIHFDGAGGLLPVNHLYLLLGINVHNGSLISFTLRSAHFDCTAGDARIAELGWPSQGEQPIAIPSRGSSDLVLRLNTHIVDPLTQLDQIDRRVTARCEGTVRLSAWGVEMFRDLSFEEQL